MFQQCGGRSNCPSNSCADVAWKNATCDGGAVCVRKGEFLSCVQEPGVLVNT